MANKATTGVDMQINSAKATVMGRRQAQRLQTCHQKLKQSKMETTKAGKVLMWLMSDKVELVTHSVNGIYIGVVTEVMCWDFTMKIPIWAMFLNILFFLLFAMEYFVDLWVLGREFFTEKGKMIGNTFDTVVLIAMFVEIVAVPLVENSLWIGFILTRVLRIIQCIVLVRRNSLRFMPDVMHQFMASIMSSLTTFLYAIIVGFLIMYIWAIFFCQTVLSYRVRFKDSLELDERGKDPLFEYWGTMVLSLLTLFQSISSGNDWAIFLNPIAEQISVFYGPLFALYIAFVVFALMNVVTGIFVEAAIKNAKKDKEKEMEKTVRQFLVLASDEDDDETATISREEYEAHLTSPWMKDYFEFIDVDPSAAGDVFRLLDSDGSGQVAAEEFLTGCMRLRGPARALDLSVLTYETRRMKKRFEEHADESNRKLEYLLSSHAVVTNELNSRQKSSEYQRNSYQGLTREGSAISGGP